MTANTEAQPRNAETASLAGPQRAEGTQAIRRAVSIMKVVAAGQQPGVTLASIADAIGLSRSTTHRILSCLAAEGLLEVDAKRRYAIGPLTYEFSLSGLSDHHSTARYSELVGAVARRTGHTAYLMARSGGDAVCLLKIEGTARMRVAPVDVGQRRPLGVGAGGIALLAAFDADQVALYLKDAEPQLRSFWKIDPKDVLADTLEAQRKGYAVSQGRVFREVTGVGLLLPGDARGRLAVSITVPTASIQPSQIPGLAAAIGEEIERLAPSDAA